MRKRQRSEAQAMVEFALVGMAFFMLLFGTIEFGRLVWTYHELTNGTREGARIVMVRGRLAQEKGAADPTTSEVEMYIHTKVAGLSEDGLTVTGITWEDNADDSESGIMDKGIKDPGDYVTVSASYVYSPIVGMVLGTDPITLTHSTKVVVQY